MKEGRGERGVPLGGTVTPHTLPACVLAVALNLSPICVQRTNILCARSRGVEECGGGTWWRLALHFGLSNFISSPANCCKTTNNSGRWGGGDSPATPKVQSRCQLSSQGSKVRARMICRHYQFLNIFFLAQKLQGSRATLRGLYRLY